MDNDGPPFVDFKCKRCGNILCRTNGEWMETLCYHDNGDGTGYTIWLTDKRMVSADIRCDTCGKVRKWERTYERTYRIGKSH